MPGNIILIAGSPNSGKTAFMLNIIKENMNKFDTWYFNSEMGGSELQKRLVKFKDITSLRDWKFHSKGMPANIADTIAPGEGKLNIIDYLEIHTNFYEIGAPIRAIHDALKGAIAVIAIQKNPGAAAGLGGYRTLEKPRLAINLEPGGICKIAKAKNWKTEMNPNGRQRKFFTFNGCELSGQGEWYFPGKDE
jgi:hypothetical protein